MAAARRLTPRPPNARQRRFIDEYLRTDDAPAAAIAAGYSKSQAKKNAGRLLRAPSVAHVLRAELDARAERTRLAGDRIVLELARIAFSDLSRIVDWDDAAGGLTVRPLAELSEGDRAAVARVTRHGSRVTIALHDKVRALDTLGKYFKLWGKHSDKIRPDALHVYSDEAQRKARAALKQRIMSIVDERQTRERAAKLQEEAEWAAAWRAHFG